MIPFTMEKTIIKLGKRNVEFNLTRWPEGSALTLDDDGLKKQVQKTRVIGHTPNGDVLRRVYVHSTGGKNETKNS